MGRTWTPRYTPCVRVCVCMCVCAHSAPSLFCIGFGLVWVGIYNPSNSLPSCVPVSSLPLKLDAGSCGLPAPVWLVLPETLALPLKPSPCPSSKPSLPQVVYRTRDLVPDTPGEPKDSGGGKDGGGSSPAAKASAAVGARPFPWLPVAEAGDTDGRMDWWRQNLVLWELGVRLAGGWAGGWGVGR